MIRRTPRSTPTYTPVPYTTLCRSLGPEGEPGERGLPDATRLLRPDGLPRVAVAGSGARLHLAEEERPAAADDEVELVASRVGVRVQDPVAAQAEIGRAHV